MSSRSDFSDRIAASREEMLAAYRRVMQTAAPTAPPAPEPKPAPDAAPPAPETKPVPPISLPIPAPTPRPEDTATGALQIRASAAGRSIPIPQALVVVTRPGDGGEELVALGETDESGLTDTWFLPAPDPRQFESPETVVPPALYTIRTFADGYVEVENLQVPLYGGIKVIQDVNMIPLPEATPFSEVTFIAGPPTNL